MIKTVDEMVKEGGGQDLEILLQYEPYYLNTTANIETDHTSVKRLTGGGASGDFSLSEFQDSDVISGSSQVPPSQGD